MRRAAALAAAAQAHRREVEACTRAFSAAAGRWAEPVRPGAWTRAEIAEHLAISYDPPLSELGGGPGFALRLPWWKRRIVRWKALPMILRGGFPTGAPAPREIRPASASPSPAAAEEKLRARSERFLGELEKACATRRVRLTHAYFGRISALEVLHVLTSHARHHRRQLEG